MKNSFGHIFVETFKKEGTRIVDLVNATGVTRSKVNKLLDEPSRTVNVEDAMAIARFYGKSVEQFASGQTVEGIEKFKTLAELLTDEEADLLSVQIEAVVARRLTQSKPPSPNAPKQS